MNIFISEEAVNWYKKELGIKTPSYVRFYVRYGGMGGRIPGFSIGINIESPTNILASTESRDLTFYVEESDAWYFDGKDLIISLDNKLKEPSFSYQ